MLVGWLAGGATCADVERMASPDHSPDQTCAPLAGLPSSPRGARLIQPSLAMWQACVQTKQ